MQRSSEIEELVVELLRALKAGDIAGVESMMDAGPATLLLGNGPDDRYVGGDAVLAHFRDAIAAYGGVPFQPGAAEGWVEGAVGWFADNVTVVFPERVIPLRLTGVAVNCESNWRIVQLHLSAAVSDEELLAGDSSDRPLD